MKRNIFNKKMILSIVCLLFVAIIPLCSLNLINYSALLASTSEEVVDDETENSAEDVDTDGDGEDTGATAANGFWHEQPFNTPTKNSSGAYIIDSKQDFPLSSSSSAASGWLNFFVLR